MKATKNVCFIWLTAFFLFVGPVASCANASEEDAALKKELFAALASMQTYDQLQFHVRCLVESSDSEEGMSGKKESKTEYELAKNGDCYISIREVEKSKGVRAKILRCSNGSYAFAIDKSTSPPSVVYLERLGVDAAMDKQVASQKMLDFDVPINRIYGHMVVGKPLPDLINTQDFSIKKLVKREVLGKTMVELDFEYDGFDAEHNDKYRLTEGKLLLDPANHWVVVSASWIYESLNFKAKAKEEWQRDFAFAQADCPVASKSIMKYESEKFKHESIWTVDLKRQEVPKEEFFLTFYGLPEPQFDKSFLEKWGWWLIGGIVFLAAGGWLTMKRSTK
jgi:hypothetical protein